MMVFARIVVLPALLALILPHAAGTGTRFSTEDSEVKTCRSWTDEINKKHDTCDRGNYRAWTKIRSWCIANTSTFPSKPSTAYVLLRSLLNSENLLNLYDDLKHRLAGSREGSLEAVEAVQCDRITRAFAERGRATCDFSKHALGRSLNMVTVAKACAGVAWCINPCQVLYEQKDAELRLRRPTVTHVNQTHISSPSNSGEPTCEDSGTRERRVWAGRAPASAPKWASFSADKTLQGKQSAVAYATKEGHLIQGEERMRVMWFNGQGGDDSVWFEVYSISRGAGFAGRLVFPLIQSMQKRFFREQAETMRRLICAPSDSDR